MDDLGQLILFFICAAIFGMGVSFLFNELKAARRIEVGEVIYIIQGDEIKPAKIVAIKITEDETIYRANPAAGACVTFTHDEIGKAAFWSEEEALEELR